MNWNKYPRVGLSIFTTYSLHFDSKQKHTWIITMQLINRISWFRQCVTYKQPNKQTKHSCITLYLQIQFYRHPNGFSLPNCTTHNQWEILIWFIGVYALLIKSVRTIYRFGNCRHFRMKCRHTGIHQSTKLYWLTSDWLQFAPHNERHSFDSHRFYK